MGCGNSAATDARALIASATNFGFRRVDTDQRCQCYRGTEDRLIRIAGAERPIDVFFVPNEFEAGDFEGVWERGTSIDPGVRLIEAIDLIVTKQLTDRPHDETDIRFLTNKM